MKKKLTMFLIHYNTVRLHSTLRKELNVKTPFQAVEKWYELNPETFKINPQEFENILLCLNPGLKKERQQRGET